MSKRHPFLFQDPLLKSISFGLVIIPFDISSPNSFPKAFHLYSLLFLSFGVTIKSIPKVSIPFLFNLTSQRTVTFLLPPELSILIFEISTSGRLSLIISFPSYFCLFSYLNLLFAVLFLNLQSLIIIRYHCWASGHCSFADFSIQFKAFYVCPLDNLPSLA